MTETKTYCDRCGKETSGKLIRFEHTLRMFERRFEYSASYDNYDVCDECFEEFKGWWKGKINERN